MSVYRHFDILRLLPFYCETKGLQVLSITLTAWGSAGGCVSCRGAGASPEKLPFLYAGHHIRRYKQCQRLTRLKSWMRCMNVTIQRFQSISSIWASFTMLTSIMKPVTWKSL